jgi:hypothetical protein
MEIVSLESIPEEEKDQSESEPNNLIEFEHQNDSNKNDKVAETEVLDLRYVNAVFLNK